MEYRVREEEPPSRAVVRAVADVTDRDPTDMEPIAETIDPEAIDEMFTRSSDDVATLTLLYEGCRIEVDDDAVVVEEIPGI